MATYEGTCLSELLVEGVSLLYVIEKAAEQDCPEIVDFLATQEYPLEHEKRHLVWSAFYHDASDIKRKIVQSEFLSADVILEYAVEYGDVKIVEDLLVKFPKKMVPWYDCLYKNNFLDIPWILPPTEKEQLFKKSAHLFEAHDLEISTPDSSTTSVVRKISLFQPKVTKQKAPFQGLC
jgi:hypothetical protein